MNQLQMASEALKKLYTVAPSPEARMVVRHALGILKSTTRHPDSAWHRNRLLHYRETLDMLRGYSDNAELALDRGVSLGLSREEGKERRKFYSAVKAALSDAEAFFSRNRGEPEPLLCIAGPRFIGEDEGTWEALFRSVDLWKLKAHFYGKCCRERGGMKKLYERAWQWLEDAVTCPRGSTSYPEAYLAYCISNYINPQPRHYHSAKAYQELRINAAVAQMILQEVTATLRRGWLAVHRPDLLN